MGHDRVYQMSLAGVYPLYLAKVTRKGRTQAELDAVIRWLTGYSPQALRDQVDGKITMAGFFAQAPSLNEARKLIKGVVCGVRVEEIQDPTMQNIRYLDKLVDELAKGKSLDKILRR